MGYRAYVPCPPLADYVAMLWYYQGTRRAHNKERILPTGTIELIINLGEDETRIYDNGDTSRCQRLGGTIVCGIHSETFVIDTAEQDLVMGVHFKPGGAFPFLGMPADESLNCHISLEDLWGPAAGDVRERLLIATAIDTRFRILESYLLARARRVPPRHPAVGYALTAFKAGPQAPTVAAITARVGLSARRFIELFRREVGLPPKLYYRIQRFQDALHRIAADRPVDWVNLALRCGYFDQAHFIHDFRAFSGLSPGDYRTRATEHLNHIPLID